MGYESPAFWGFVAWVAIPLGIILLDVFPALLAGRARVCDFDENTPYIDDFEILVPIYGHIKYLENVDFLSTYGSKVVLCTTTEEDAEFNESIEQIARDHGFRLFTTDVPGRKTEPGKRAVAAPIRDKLIRDALDTVTATYVVCIDADTATGRPLNILVGALAASDLDVASVRLLPSNPVNLLTRLQCHEYYMAMRMRRLYPWLVSGACHVAKTSAHHAVMQQHSLFFQGNDVEFGILADAMGYEVGHIPFDVPTTVPDKWWPWLRQRYAWVGGEFRVYIANIKFARRQPFFYFYGVVVVFLSTPFRWWTLIQFSDTLLLVFVTYVLALLMFNRTNVDLHLLLLPFYMMIGTLILVPLGAVSYVRMAMTHKNWGIMRPGTRRLTPQEAVRPHWSGAPVFARSVRSLQRDLAEVGYDPGPIDGEFGPRTSDALVLWQYELIDLGYDLGPAGADGVFGPITSAASRSEAPWRGVTDESVSTRDWIERYRATDLFALPA